MALQEASVAKEANATTGMQGLFHSYVMKLSESQQSAAVSQNAITLYAALTKNLYCQAH